MGILSEIAEWAKKIPAWQADALRRIWEGGISAKDIAELASVLKVSKGISVPNSEKLPKLKPFEYTTPTATDAAAFGTAVQRIHSIQHVNRIKSDAEINFITNGLTVIYGDNASGKSGYGRIFRRACRARGNHPPILGNLFSKQAIKTQASVKFELISKAGTSTIDWNDGIQRPPELAHVAMFDKDCARYHIEEDNRVDFLPYGADLLTDLSNTCDAIRDALKVELSACNAVIPEALTKLTTDGTTSKFIRAITFATPEERLTKFAEILEADANEYARLNKLMVERKRKSPKELADEYRKRATRIKNMLGEVATLDSILGSKAILALKELQESAESAQRDADELSKQDFSKGLVSGVGTKLWQTMFEAARKFAETEAFPTKKYEESFKDGKCVLCHQDLSEEAGARLARFDAFVKNNIAAVAKERRESLEAKQEQISRLDTTQATKYAELLDVIRETKPGLADAASAIFESATNAKTQVSKALKDSNWENIASLSADQVSRTTSIKALATKLEEDATAIESLKPTAEQLAEEARWIELKERLAFRDNLGGMVTYLTNLKQQNRYNECLKEVNTRPITGMYATLVETALTEELQIALRAELGLIGLDWIQPRFEPKHPKSQLHQRIVLDGVPADVALTGVLSEGEGLVLAIASFLAELRVATGFDVVVFDDPVSSLDHLWRDKIAERLVDLSKTRQVIVFTHDLYFLFGLIQECEYQTQPNALVHAIGKLQNETGVILSPDDKPNEMKRPQESFKTLKKLIDDAEARLTEVGDLMHESYRTSAGRFYDSLRRVWERVIEHYLFGDVVARFRPNIAFTNLDRIVAGLDAEDIKLIKDSMAKASKWITGHSSALAARTITPKPAEMTANLEDLKDCVKKLEAKRASKKVAAAAEPATSAT